jgi:hypothetical protein
MTLGRTTLRALAAATTVSGFLADWNRTHLFNPAWPPHARFHDAMTIALGTGLGGVSIYLLRNEADRREVALGAALPALFWGSMGAAFAFPGTAGLEAEFPQYVPRLGGVWKRAFPERAHDRGSGGRLCPGTPGRRPDADAPSPLTPRATGPGRPAAGRRGRGRAPPAACARDRAGRRRGGRTPRPGASDRRGPLRSRVRMSRSRARGTQ